MATSFDDVIDLALVIVNDYSLGAYYERDEEGFKKFCDGLLISAIPNFFQCRKSLDYDAETRMFVSELDNIEVSILADFWAMQWATRIINTKAYLEQKMQS